MRPAALAAVVPVLLLAIAGCSAGDGDGQATPSPSPTTTDLDLPSEQDPRVDRGARYDERFLEKPNVLSRGQGLVRVATVDKTLPTGERWLPLTATPDGQLVISVYSRSDPSANGVALLDPETDETTTIAEGQRWPVFDADVEGRWIVWTTSGGQDAFTFPWELWAHDRRTGETRKISVAPDVGVKPIPAAPNGTSPDLHEGVVYLSAAEDVPKPGRVDPAVYSVPVDGSERMRKLIDHAYDPRVTRDRLYYVVGNGGSFRTWDIRTRDLNSGQDESLRSATGGPRLAGDAAGRSALGWQEQADGRCRLFVSTASGSATELLSARCRQYFQYYGESTERYLSFSFNRTRGYVPYVYDLEHRRLARVGDDAVRTSVEGYGDLMFWEPTTGPDKGKVVVARLTDEAPVQASEKRSR